MKKPELAPNSIVTECDSKEKCPLCDSSIQRIFGKSAGCIQEKCKNFWIKPMDMNARDFIKYLNARKNWHGKQYRSLCGHWLAKNHLYE